MKSEKPNNKGNAQAPYASPDVKVVEIKAQGVLCQSGGEYIDPFGDSETL